MMIKKLIMLSAMLLVVMAVLPAQAQEITQPAPIWLFSNCDLPSITLGWYNPPPEVLPFTGFFPAYLSILGDGYGETEIMTYVGQSTCPNYPGCVYYRWRAVYTLPDRPYYLSAYVVNAADQTFDVVPVKFYPGCNQDTNVRSYLPFIYR